MGAVSAVGAAEIVEHALEHVASTAGGGSRDGSFSMTAFARRSWSSPRRSGSPATYSFSSRAQKLREPRRACRRREAERRSPADRACRCGRSATCPSARRTRATTSCDVGPAGLSTTSTPFMARAVSAVPRRWRGRALDDNRLDLLERTVDGEPGGVLVAAAAVRVGHQPDVDVVLRPHADANVSRPPTP